MRKTDQNVHMQKRGKKPKLIPIAIPKVITTESTPRGGVNRCMANLMTNNAELKTKCNTLSVTKECSRIPGEGL